MKRAIAFLCIAIFLALIIQPNLSASLKDTSRVPENTTHTAKTNENADLKQSKSKSVICIDAGNGGDDFGYTVEGQVPEKELNLNIALKLGEYLTQMGYQVIYTRTDDNIAAYENENDSARERIAYAKTNNAQYLISIQMNYDNDPLTRGYSIFTQENEDMIKTANQIAENLESINYSEFQGLDSDHYANFSILSDPNMTGIMIELGYITNYDDYTKLTDTSFQDKLAKAISEAILEEIN